MIKIFISLEERLFIHSVNCPGKIAVITDAGQKRVTYSELFKYVQSYSEFLRMKGVRQGTIVTIQADQTLEYVIAYFAIHLSGGVVASLEKNLPKEEVLRIANVLGAKHVIVPENENLDNSDYVIINELGVLEEATRACVCESDSFPGADELADILFTTGTTGTSKGVMLTHKALVATAENLIEGCGYQKDTNLILPGPLNHANAIRKLFTTIYNGSTIAILNGMTNLKVFYETLDFFETPIACCLPPAAIRLIFTLSGEKIGDYKDKIDFIETATAPLPEPDKIHLAKLLNKTRLINNYGSSESASVCMYDYSKYGGKKGCIGRPAINSQIIIVDDNGNAIDSSKDRQGLIACVGETNMIGYINDPETTATVLKDGVVYTNDIGYLDEDGFVYISGRKGDVINVGGFKVAPTEVEEVALELDEINDCICIPDKHPISGYVPKLLVVTEASGKIDMRKVRDYLTNRLESYKVPVKYEVVDKIERTYNGKLNRKAYLEK